MTPLRLRVRQAAKLLAKTTVARRKRVANDYHIESARRSWLKLTEQQRQLDQAEQRGWHSAATNLRVEIRWTIDDLQRQLQPSACEPTLRDWLEELDALESEFDDVRIDLQAGVVRVTTEPVRLRDVELGAFAIEWHLSRLGTENGAACFEIVALDPNPAAGRSDVPHPHVSDGGLCAGDAERPLAKALADGRLSEALLLIRSVLTTYNPKSAYVQLEQWDGITCGDCRERVSRESAGYCEGCHSDLCEPCTTSCRCCDAYRCAACLTECEVCSDLCCSGCIEFTGDESLCRSCRAVCSDCDAVVRRSELDGADRCPDCAKAAEELATTEADNMDAEAVVVEAADIQTIDIARDPVSESLPSTETLHTHEA
jgi:hypothetical protein